jgi:hypothetical protein
MQRSVTYAMAVHPNAARGLLGPAALTGTGLLLAAGLGLHPVVPAAHAAPELVVLLRHGHKSGETSNYNLSRQGLERALDLATLIPSCFGRPSHIITFELDPTSSKNARSYQTAVPLGVATGVNISLAMGSRQNSRVIGERILRDPHSTGGRIVMYWEHRMLPELAAGLGWPNMAPIADDDFDRLFVLRYPNPASPPQVSQLSQLALLSGQQTCASLPVQLQP